jgi:riboflavin synthase
VFTGLIREVGRVLSFDDGRLTIESAQEAALGDSIAIDGVGTVRSVEAEGEGKRIWTDAPPDLLRYVVEKGSIALQGTSLTVAAVDEQGFAVALIPHTLQETTLDGLAAGDRVNLEADVLAKYVEKLLPR